MDRLIYTAFTGMSDSMVRQRAIANNMANASTVGFRAERFDSTPMSLRQPQSIEARTMVSTAVLGADMSAGAVIDTGNPLDIAVQGEWMMAVQAVDGNEAYTRRGDLSVSPAGILVNGEGRPVIGNGGPIAVPADSAVTIGKDGSVLIGDPDNPAQPGNAIDRIKLVSWEGSQISKATDNLFRVNGGGALPADEEATVLSGALEQSNVNMTTVLVDMIEAQRLFDIRTKLVATAKEIDEGGASLMRL